MKLEADSLETKKLRENFLASGEAETEEGFHRKSKLFNQLEQIWREWIFKASLNRQMPRELAEEVRGKFGIFGSQGLKVHLKSSDIDIVGMASRHILRYDFFTSFVEKLKKCSDVKALQVNNPNKIPQFFEVFLANALKATFKYKNFYFKIWEKIPYQKLYKCPPSKVGHSIHKHLLPASPFFYEIS